MTGWEIFWVGWLISAGGSLLVAEGIALWRGETLSKVTRRWLGVEPRKPWRAVAVPVFVVAVAGFAAWFIPHITG